MDRRSALMKILRSQRFVDAILLTIGLTLAISLRFAVRSHASEDFFEATNVWYSALKEDGFAATATDVSDYTPTYMYILYLVSLVLPSVSAVTAIKIPSIVFDFVCAWFVYRLVGLKYRDGPIPIFSLFAVLFAPTVVLNSAVWGQADSIYAAMLVACVYFLIRGRGTAASLAFGAAFAVKLQAVFLAPLLIALALKRILSWRSLAMVPLVYLVAMLPAWIAGRPLVDLLTIYWSQSQSYKSLALNVPNMYAWLPEGSGELFFAAGLVWAMCLSYLFILLVLKSKARLDPAIMIRLGLLSLIMVPFSLPRMHDRYFFPADVLSIAYGFTFPQHFFVPIMLNLISFFAYQPFLFKRDVVSMSILALAMLFILVFVARKVVIDLYAGQGRIEAE